MAAPQTMRIWKYDSADGGLQKHLKLYPSEPLPKPMRDQHLIQVLSVSLNPVDFKPAEAPLVGRLAVKKPAVPGFDLAGRLVIPAPGSSLQPGQLVFGAASTNPVAGGALAEYIAASAQTIHALPSTGVTPQQAASLPVAAITASASLLPHLTRPNMRVFLNGGSGGVGTFAIQIAKLHGAHVTVSCSPRNAELCRSLGADVVLDYTAKDRPLLRQLRDIAASSTGAFDLVVDNVLSDTALFFQAHTYTTPSVKFVEVAWEPSWACAKFVFEAMIWPTFLGGRGRRKFVLAGPDIKHETLEQTVGWVKDGKVRPVIDRVFAMEEAVEAFERLKTGRAAGKVIVTVAEEK